MCEYAHAMGNSGGNLQEYWEAIEDNHGLQGGFIWEWLDHGLLEKHGDTEYWAYGGDFGEWRHDLNFVCDGLCWPDRTPHSSLLEYKKIIQPVAVERLSSNQFRITNKNYFTRLDWLSCSWHISIDGVTNQSGKIGGLRIDPQHAADITLDFLQPKLRPGQEAMLTFSFNLARKQSWAAQGHPVGWAQFRLARRKSAVIKFKGNCQVSVPANRSGKSIKQPDSRTINAKIETENSILTFSNRGLKSWRFNGQQIIVNNPLVNLWRAPLDNDGIKGKAGQDHKALGKWTRLGLNKLRIECQDLKMRKRADGTIELSTRIHSLAVGGKVVTHTRYVIYPNDTIRVEHSFSVGAALDDLPRLGIRWQLPSAFEQLQWYGAGPHETYCDRQTSGMINLHKSTVTDQYVPYILPQDHGNLTQVRSLTLATANGISFRVNCDEGLQASASHYPQEILTPAFHTWELTPKAETYLCLDAAQRGVGGASCGPDTLPQYRIAAGKHQLSYTIKVETS
jgi:beta-galactosidase